jgi:hypothetical protein
MSEQAKEYIQFVIEVSKENCHSPQDAWALVIEFLNKALKEIESMERQAQIDRALPGEY